jgi:lipid II:glycine glycyltransferase (peptidoglycan interpeptide bridge formation enzyme)
MIQWARQRGLRYFDFVSMDPDAARVIVEGGVTHNMPENETSYKLGFGGDIKLLPGAYYYMINPVVRTLLRCGLASLLDSPVIWKLATASRNLKTRLRHA